MLDVRAFLALRQFHPLARYEKKIRKAGRQEIEKPDSSWFPAFLISLLLGVAAIG
jgi:hypothetical protein